MGVGSEVAPPKTVGYHRDPVFRVCQFILREGASGRHWHTKRREELWRDSRTLHTHSSSGTADDEAAVLINREGRERFDNAAPVKVIWNGGRRALNSCAWIRVENRD